MRTIYRPQFWLDVEEGIACLARKASPGIACRWHDEVMATVKRVENQPDLGRLRRDLTPTDIRSLVLRRFPRYLLFYISRGDMIEILRVKHGMMNLPALFGSGG